MLESAKERLKRVVRYSWPERRKLSGSRWLIALALVIVIVVILAVAMLGGRGAIEVVQSYVDWLNDWASWR